MTDAPPVEVPSLPKRRHRVVDSVVQVDEEPPAGETRALKRAAPAAPAQAAECLNRRRHAPKRVIVLRLLAAMRSLPQPRRCGSLRRFN